LIFDEAQNLSVEVLEELRLLSNINSEKDLVLQIIACGPTRVAAKLSRPELKQFAQRVSVYFHLKSLECDETHAYIRHRLVTAGGNPSLFRPEAIELLYARTRGVPRLLNQLCDFALVYGFADRRTEIDAALVTQVMRDCRKRTCAAHYFRSRRRSPGRDDERQRGIERTRASSCSAAGPGVFRYACDS
jgi:general secretion pathway protein A